VPGEAGEEAVVVALTCSSIPETGVFDLDLMYRLQFYTSRSLIRPWSSDDHSLQAMTAYLEGIEDKFFGEFRAAEIRVTPEDGNLVRVEFTGFPGGDLSATVKTNEVVALAAPDGSRIKACFGGREDACFNDLTGFFRSINYAPQF
jgi:hypothetical protein